MKKERLASFKKRLLEKHEQLADGVGRTAIYGKDQEDDSIKDLGDQANNSYAREFFFELGNGNHRLLRDVVTALQKIDNGSFGECERCGESIADPGERKRVLDRLKSFGREVILIDRKQVERFTGNVLQLQTKEGGKVLAISTTACLSLRPDQRDAIQKFAHLVESPLPVFEGIGRGSARCMMADVHLPRK